MENPPSNQEFIVRVVGIPVPQGSAAAFRIPGRDQIVVTSSNPNLKSWRQLVAVTCAQKWGQRPAHRGAVHLQLHFMFPRPGGHFHPRKLQSLPLRLKNVAPADMVVRPDLDKLVRSICDSLTDAGVISDDARINDIHATKSYADDQENPGVHIVCLFP